jgi:hypothetical protein
MSETYAALIDAHNIVRNVVVITKEVYDSGFLEGEWLWLAEHNLTIGEPIPEELLAASEEE